MLKCFPNNSDSEFVNNIRYVISKKLNIRSDRFLFITIYIAALQKVLNNVNLCLHREQVGVGRKKKAAKTLACGSHFHTCLDLLPWLNVGLLSQGTTANLQMNLIRFMIKIALVVCISAVGKTFFT